MPKFAFTAKDAEGRTRTGVQEAASEEAVLGRIRADGMIALGVEKAGQGAGEPRTGLRLWRLLGARPVDVELGCQQIAYMLRSGVPLLSALQTTAAQSTRRSMGAVWTQVAERVQSGGSFSEALSAHSCFPNFVTTMVAVGEQTGQLDEVLMRSSSALERRRLLKTNLLTAMIYPTLVVILSITVVAYMMVALIPKLSKFLAGFGRRLPPMTQMLMDISTAVQTYWIHGLVGLLFAAGVFAVIRAWPPGRLGMDRVVLAIPIIGPIFRLAETATVSRNLGSLLASGVRITEALRAVEPLLRNKFAALKVTQARDRVLQGSSLAEPLSTPGIFYPMLGHMVAVGEASGTLDEVLEHVAEFHEKRLEAMIRRMSALIEPVIILMVGGIVGFIYMAFFVALYSIVGGRS